MHETMETPNAGMRLHHARLSAGLELRDIERRTRISPSILRWIDDAQFHRLPAGIYARSYIRAFAEAVGLDPSEIVASLEHALPPAAELTPPHTAPERSSRLAPEWLRVAAAVVDAGILSLMYGLVVAATAAACGRSVADVIGPALPPMAVVLLALTAIYFVIFAGIGGRTPGGRFLGLPPLDVSGPVHLQAIGTRALRVFASQASFGLDLASRRSARADISTADPYGSRSTP
jgi:hypothetical protein